MGCNIKGLTFSTKILLTTPLFTALSPSSGSLLLDKFLVVTSQLEHLKIEWGIKLLNCHAINTQKLAKDLEDLYTERVLNPARRVVAKRQTRDLARKQAEEVRVQF